MTTLRHYSTEKKKKKKKKKKNTQSPIGTEHSVQPPSFCCFRSLCNAGVRPEQAPKKLHRPPKKPARYTLKTCVICVGCAACIDTREKVFFFLLSVVPFFLFCAVNAAEPHRNPVPFYSFSSHSPPLFHSPSSILLPLLHAVRGSLRFKKEVASLSGTQSLADPLCDKASKKTSLPSEA